MRKSFVTVIAATFVAAAIPALAHHASQAEFDKNSPKTITGVLTRVQWTNPHVRWYLDIKNEKTGEVETWMIQGSGPGAYKANGVSATARRTRVFFTTLKYTPEARAFARSCVIAATGMPRFSAITMA